MEYITPLLFATVVLADYYIDNANTSVVYSMPASQSGQAWQTFSVVTPLLALSFSNSTGSYNITLDPSHCYDQNYALGVCGTADDCFVQMPFTGSGITMYVFSAGASGMTAGFSVDGGAPVTSSIPAPPVALNYQVSNVSLYDIQGLPTGNHTMKMTLLDWNGVSTSMKFDYARVNETFVAPQVTTSSAASATSTQASGTSSQVPTQISAVNPVPSPSIRIGDVIGGALGGLALCGVLAIGFFHLRRRRSTAEVTLTPESTFQVHPFPSDHDNSTPPSMLQKSFSPLPARETTFIAPLTRSAILRDALAAAGNAPSPGSDQSSRPSRSGLVQPALRRQPLHSGPDIDIHRDVHLNVSHAADANSLLSDPEMALRYNLTADQVEVVDRLRRNNVPLDTVMRVIEGFQTSNLPGRETNDRKLVRRSSHASAAPPPSYQSDA